MAVPKGLTKEERERAIAKIQAHFRSERDEELGDLAAGLILDFFARDIGPYFFNLGVRAAKAQVERTLARLDEDLDGIEQLPPR